MVMAKKPSIEVPTKPRGTPIVLPPWWLLEVNRQVAGIKLENLAETLSDLALRPVPWERGTVGKFLKNKFPTFEMMLAFCRFLPDVPPPVFIARSFEEAMRLASESARYDDAVAIPLAPEQRGRVTKLDNVRETLERFVDGRSAGVLSPDAEGTGRRRRANGVVRGGKKTS